MSKKRNYVVSTVFAAGVAMTGFASAAQAESAMDRVKSSGTITVGIANEKPYGYLDSDGTAKGVIIDVLRAVVEQAGVEKVEGNVNEFGALIPSIVAGRFDVIGAGMYITPKRCEAIAFSNPITRAINVLGAKTGDPSGVHSLEEIAKSDKIRVGTQSGTAQIDELKKAGIPDSQIVLFSREQEAVAGLQAGRVDVIYYPALELAEMIKKFGDGGIERVEPFNISKGEDGKPLLNYQAFGFNKADVDLVKVFNDGIDKLKASGELEKLLKPYGFTAQDIPDASETAASICGR